MKEETLKEARERAGFTQAQMAAELGITRPTYSKIEENPASASVLQAKRICELLSRNYEYIFFGRRVNQTSAMKKRNAPQG